LNADRRESARIPAAAEAKLLVLGGQERAIHCRIENVSDRGCRLTVGEPIRMGAAVVIVVDQHWLMGEVVYCQMLLEGYALGLQLEQQLDMSKVREILGHSPDALPEPD
jgi:hypothetical protein